ncbi:MAG: hypothetical protein JJ975_12110 [Bacteroidia bacterium]|nr:hypothetical protein [Bacteroidia bacterium]
MTRPLNNKPTIRNGLGVFVLFLFCSSCQRQDMTATEYFNHFNSFQSESYIEKSENGVRYKLQYRPKDFQAINALKGSGLIDRETVDNQMDSFADAQLYCLRIEVDSSGEDILKHNLTDQADYFRRLELLNNAFPRMTWGMSGRDTIYTGFHHFERTYKLRPFVQVLFSLNGNESQNPDEIVFEDYIFNNGTEIKFEELNQYHNRLPKLKL